MSNHIWQLYTGNFVPGMQFGRSQRQKKCLIFLPPVLAAFPTLLVFFDLGFCASCKGTILATQCHGYIVPILMWCLRLQWRRTALSTLPSYMHCMLRCGPSCPSCSRAGTPHSTCCFALSFAMRIIFSPPVNSGLLDFMWWPAFLLLIPAGPQQQILEQTVPCRPLNNTLKINMKQ